MCFEHSSRRWAVEVQEPSVRSEPHNRTTAQPPSSPSPIQNSAHQPKFTHELCGRAENLQRWHKLEIAKRRLLYTLRQLSLPTDDLPAQRWPRLQFRFLAELPGGLPVLTGYDRGVITVNLVEADDPEREKRRMLLREPHRTLVGHLRHEAGHFYWDALIANSTWHERFRTLFGDERPNYQEALQRYYSQGPSNDWPRHCVSAYASAHPWEDWAETWSHLLTMVDTLETAASFGLSLRPRHPAAQHLSAEPEKALASDCSFDTWLAHWLPLTYSVNALNRGAGLLDLYPYVLGSEALEKLRFVHEVITQVSARSKAANADAPTNPEQVGEGGERRNLSLGASAN